MGLKDLTVNNENKILAYFRGCDCKPLAFPISESVFNIFTAIHSEDNWSKWVDSSQRSDVPPDFYNDNLKLMMEVMRIDDHADKHGKKNLTLSREGKMLRELEESELQKSFPNVEQVSILADSGLPTNEDHNFTRYRDNFARVVKKHSIKVSSYRKNHEGYKLIFFIFDETSGSYLKVNKKSRLSKGQIVMGSPHIFWADEDMVKEIKNSGADYVIWFKPFSYVETVGNAMPALPQIVIYDINNMKLSTESYDVDHMISSEV